MPNNFASQDNLANVLQLTLELIVVEKLNYVAILQMELSVMITTVVRRLISVKEENVLDLTH